MTKRKVIFFFLRVLDGGGVSTHCADLISALGSQGYTVILIYGGVVGSLKGQEWFAKRGITVYHIGFSKKISLKNAIKSLSSFTKFIFLLYKYRPEIIHCHFRSTFIFAMIAKTLTNAKNVLTIHLHGMPNTRITRFFQSRFDRFIVISSEIEQELLSMDVNPDRITKIYNGADHLRYLYPAAEKRGELRLKYGVQPDKIILTVVSRLVKVKSIDTFIRAIAELDQVSQDRIQCMVVGDGGQKENLTQLTHQYGLEKIIHFPGYCDPVDYYALSDVYILPSLNEGFSVSVIEAMLSGLAILRTPTSGCYDQVIENQNGFIFPFNDHQTLAEKIDFILDNPAKLASMQDASYKLALSRFTLEVMTADTIKVYDSLMEKVSPAVIGGSTIDAYPVQNL